MLAFHFSTEPGAPLCDVIKTAEQKLGLSADGKPLVERAATCYDTLYTSKLELPQPKPRSSDKTTTTSHGGANGPISDSAVVPQALHSCLVLMSGDAPRFDLCVKQGPRQTVKLLSVSSVPRSPRGPDSFCDVPAAEVSQGSPGRLIGERGVEQGRMPVRIGQLDLSLQVC